MNIVETSVLPFRQVAIEQEREAARQEIEAAVGLLQAAQGDLNEAAPYPASWWSDEEFFEKRRRHTLLLALTDPDPAKGPPFVQLVDERIDAIIEQRTDRTASDYDAFITKLVAKVGPAKEAVLSGNHVGGYSILATTTPGGEKRLWKIQQITNTSKHGKAFNQWTVRRMKG